MARKKVRTKAQRSAAAKIAWEARRLKEANEAKGAERMPKEFADTFATAGKLPVVDYGFGKLTAPSAPAVTAVATREGDELYVTISGGGSLHRHKVSAATMRKLGLDCLQLVG